MRWSETLFWYKEVVGEITPNKKTGGEIKLLVGRCSIRNRKKSRIVSDNTIQAQGLGSFFKNLGRISAKGGKQLATNALKNPGRDLEITSNFSSAAATKSPKAALSSLFEVKNFYHTGKMLYLGKFCINYTIELQQKTDRIYPSATLENIDLEQRLEKELNEVNSFENHTNKKK